MHEVDEKDLNIVTCSVTFSANHCSHRNSEMSQTQSVSGFSSYVC